MIFNPLGILTNFIGLLLTLGSIAQQEYIWLIGSIPLMFLGYYIIYQEVKGGAENGF